MKPKILAFMQLPPPVHGASIVNKNIAESQKLNNDFDLHVVPLQFSKSISVLEKFSIQKILISFKYLAILTVSLVRIKPDIVYFTLTPTGGAFYRDLIFVFVMRLFRCKHVFHLHGKGISKQQNKFCHKTLYKWVFAKSHVILLSKLLAPDLKGLVDEGSCYFVPNGVSDCTPFESKEKTSGNQLVQLLYLSNLLPEKGALVLLDALEIIKNDAKTSFKVTFAGAESPTISAEKFAQEVSRRGLDNVVNYIGPAYGDEKSKVFKQSDVFVFPTYLPHECFPLVLLEAMSFGLPVVSTYEGAIPDIVDQEETGLLVQQQDPNALANALKLLISDGDRRCRLGMAGREKYVREYSLAKFESNLSDTLHQILRS